MSKRRLVCFWAACTSVALFSLLCSCASRSIPPAPRRLYESPVLRTAVDETAHSAEPGRQARRIMVLGCRSAGDQGGMVDLLFVGVDSNGPVRPTSIAAAMSGVMRAFGNSPLPYTAPISVQRIGQVTSEVRLSPPECDFAEYRRANGEGNPFPYNLIGTPPRVTPEGLVPRGLWINGTALVVQPVIWRTDSPLRRGERVSVRLNEAWFRTEGKVPDAWQIETTPQEVEVDSYR